MIRGNRNNYKAVLPKLIAKLIINDFCLIFFRQHCLRGRIDGQRREFAKNYGNEKKKKEQGFKMMAIKKTGNCFKIKLNPVTYQGRRLSIVLTLKTVRSFVYRTKFGKIKGKNQSESESITKEVSHATTINYWTGHSQENNRLLY